MQRWRATLAEIIRDLGLIAWCIGVLFVVRLAMMIALHQHLGPQADAWQWLMTLLGGIRFDGRTAVIITGLSLLLSLGLAGTWPVAARRLRVVCAVVFASASMALGICDYYYFLEYGDQFNQFLVGIFYDDRAALASTIWQSYPVVWFGIGVVTLIAVLTWLVRRFSPSAAPRLTWWNARAWPSLLMISLILLVGLIITARGSYGRLPVQQKFAAITRDPTLNKLVRNPWDSLNTALSDHAELASASAVSVETAANTAARFFSRPVYNLDQATLCSARGDHTTRPRHIILVIMESQSAWPLLPAWRDLDLNPGLLRLSHEGAFSERFLSAGGGTMESLGTLITGIPFAGLMAGYQPLAQRPFPSAIAPIFKELGYRTRFIYAGYLSWQRLGDLASAQGFDEIHSGADMGNWLAGGEWGVDDEACYSYAANTISDASPSFTMILTTSNHPPYSVEVYRKGFGLHQAPASITNAADADWPVLGHLWYGDRCLERFVRETSGKLTQPLFAITGDHYGRKFPNATPDARERTGVPLILWAPGIIAPGTTMGPGSHLDLLPTLIERVAPAGFAYHAWGRDLLGPDAPTTTVARNAVVTADEWLDLSDEYPSGDAQSPKRSRWQKMQADQRQLGWWRIVRGPVIDHD